MAHQGTDLGRAEVRRRPAAAPLWTAVGAPQEALARARKWLLVTGILSLIAGAVAIAVPAAASVATAIFIGWILVFASIVMAAHAFSSRDDEPARLALRLLTSLLTLFIGVYLLVAPLDGTLTLTFMLAVWFFGIGIVEILAAWRQRALPGAGFVALSGALSVVLGALIVAGLPSSADWAIGLLVGINLVFFGARALALAAVLKRAIEDKPLA
ncbi:MAG TPA: DUF308 domain-containing protein [Solirubrobacteraceae bacterium]